MRTWQRWISVMVWCLIVTLVSATSRTLADLSQDIATTV